MTIFAKILSGDIPSHKVYEDDHVYAFLDINPVSPGHTLVIPKEPAETLDKLSPEAGAALGAALPKISKAVLAATGASHFNVLQNNGAPAGQSVFHVHFHIIPCHDNGRLQLHWTPGSLDSDDGVALADAIAKQF